MHNVPAEGLKIWGCTHQLKVFLGENVLLLFLQYIRVAIVPPAPPVPSALHKVDIALLINIWYLYVQVFLQYQTLSITSHKITVSNELIKHGPLYSKEILSIQRYSFKKNNFLNLITDPELFVDAELSLLELELIFSYVIILQLNYF